MAGRCTSTISSRGRRPSTPPRCPTRCWSARTAPTSTRCPRWSTTSTSRITHVIRGEDHVSNTGTQIEIIEALGGTVPFFAHHNLLTGAEGEGLSKRLGSLSLAELREQGLRGAGGRDRRGADRHQPAGRALRRSRGARRRRSTSRRSRTARRASIRPSSTASTPASCTRCPTRRRAPARGTGPRRRAALARAAREPHALRRDRRVGEARHAAR